ncbi:hypothetical protein WJX72_003858 [[Myrmecia] bisecta]|uniref:Uncharacterized protein n=1 Tax=[Myrmecia] bisecta TaxID=41462 RepID=A0AAW1PSJ0_9CHLO
MTKRSTDISQGAPHTKGTFLRDLKALNEQFASWVQTQLEQHPLELWSCGVEKYLQHARQLLAEVPDHLATTAKSTPQTIAPAVSGLTAPARDPAASAAFPWGASAPGATASNSSQPSLLWGGFAEFSVPAAGAKLGAPTAGSGAAPANGEEEDGNHNVFVAEVKVGDDSSTILFKAPAGLHIQFKTDGQTEWRSRGKGTLTAQNDKRNVDWHQYTQRVAAGVNMQAVFWFRRLVSARE